MLRDFPLADLQAVKKSRGKPGERLEKAADLLMGCFRVCASDNRAGIEDSKKWGMLNLVNQLFKIYFKINKLHLCKPLIRAIESLPIKDRFSLSQLITYSSGNLLQLNEALQKHEAFFIRCGIFLILEKLKVITYRNLFKKVYLVLDKKHHVPIRTFTTALKMMQVEGIDDDETQCIIANLIWENKIKGYISEPHKLLVVSKANPFPVLSSIL
nr:hypothetical protein BaRGS_000571 [Batillaria attramentaria]